MRENNITAADQADFDRRWKLAEEQMLKEMSPSEIYHFFSNDSESETSENNLVEPGPSVMGFLKWLAEPVSNFLRSRKTK